MSTAAKAEADKAKYIGKDKANLQVTLPTGTKDRLGELAQRCGCATITERLERLAAGKLRVG